MANEKRLIDANALQERMFDYYDCVNEHTSKSTYTGETLMDYEVAGMIEDCIENAPTVDAVEVVRCENCQYWNQRYEIMGMCMKHNSIVTFTKPDFYCAWGKDKNDGICKEG